MFITVVLLKNDLNLLQRTGSIQSLLNNSNIWYRPRPGHSPRFDPRKFKNVMKLNLSTDTVFTSMLWEKARLNKDVFPECVDTGPGLTSILVLLQGSTQSDTFVPKNKSPGKIFNC